MKKKLLLSILVIILIVLVILVILKLNDRVKTNNNIEETTNTSLTTSETIDTTTTNEVTTEAKEDEVATTQEKKNTNQNNETTKQIETKEITLSNEDKLEAIINKDFNTAILNNEITKYVYPYQIDNTLKKTIESRINNKIDYSTNRFYIVNSSKLINDNGLYLYDSYTNKVIKANNTGKRSTGTWFWCGDVNHKVLTNMTTQKDYFDKLEKYNITEIYLCVNHNQLLTNNIKTFIRNAYARNMKVYFCLGEVDFLYDSSYKGSIYNIFDAVDNYNKKVNYNERFAGITYDAEVWNNQEYNWRNNKEARNQHIRYISTAKKYADSKNLEVIFTLPFWIIQYDSIYGNMYDAICNILGRTTLMIYRDSYDKLYNLIMNKQENATDTLMNIAKKNNTILDIAVETMYSDEGNQVTFYEEESSNPGYLLSTLKKLDNSLKNYNNHMFSIHHSINLINDFQGGLKE